MAVPAGLKMIMGMPCPLWMPAGSDDGNSAWFGELAPAATDGGAEDISNERP